MKTNTGEKSVSVRLEQLHPFENHPFRVVEDDALKQLAQSITMILPSVFETGGSERSSEG